MIIPKPTKVKALDKYVIWVLFADSTEGKVDLSGLISKPVFKKWNDPHFFEKVYIDTETSAIAWDDTIELCPDSMYLKVIGKSFEQMKLS